jgi:hypothetical protein
MPSGRGSHWKGQKQTFSRCIRVIDTEEGTGQEVIKRFWKGFTILEMASRLYEMHGMMLRFLQ